MDKSVNSDNVIASQIRAARAMLGMTAHELARLTGLSLNTIRKAEIEDRIATLTTANLRAIRQALESAGVAFVALPDCGRGVCLKEDRSAVRA